MRLRVSLLGGLLTAGVSSCAPSAGTPTNSQDPVNSGGTGAPATTVEGASTPARPKADSEPGAAVNDSTLKGGIPVLVFHQICAAACADADTYGVSQDELDRILTVLDARGYQTISMADFARAHAGDSTGLPDKPLLITFDDGREDAYVGADPILATHGMQATMFVITNSPGAKPTFYMSWPEIQQAAASGRWTMQLHAHAGHVEMPVAIDATGEPVLGSFYANLECQGGAACSSYETNDAWRQRAFGDIETGDAMLAATLGALYESRSFAVPYGDFGQYGTNDARIPEELRVYFDARFAVWFTQPSLDPPFMNPSLATHQVARFRLTNELDSADVEAWLIRHEAR